VFSVVSTTTALDSLTGPENVYLMALAKASPRAAAFARQTFRSAPLFRVSNNASNARLTLIVPWSGRTARVQATPSIRALMKPGQFARRLISANSFAHRTPTAPHLQLEPPFPVIQPANTASVMTQRAPVMAGRLVVRQARNAMTPMVLYQG
jgi:hypothetical protein